MSGTHAVSAAVGVVKATGLSTLRSAVSIAGIAFSLILGGHAAGQQDGRGKAADNLDRSQSRAETISFSSRDRETIRVYYKNLYSKIPGRASGQGGNPGPQFQLRVERDGVLLPKVVRRLKPFPADLDGRLPHLSPNFVRGSIDSDILIIDQRSGRVIDIIHDFLSF